jgi:hypothetical protein
MTGAEIAELLEMPLSTVGAMLNRIGLGRLSRLEPQEPANGYQRGAAGRARPCRCEEARQDRPSRPPDHGRVAGGGQHRRSFHLGWEYVHVLYREDRLSRQHVPCPDSIESDEETKQLRRECLPLNLNRFDAAAVAHAAHTKTPRSARGLQ